MSLVNPSSVVPATSPSNTLTVVRRNGDKTQYQKEKISAAISKAFLAVEGALVSAEKSVQEKILQLTDQITAQVEERFSIGQVHIEEIQNIVESVLMRDLTISPNIARSYILYREERRKLRENNPLLIHKPLRIQHPSGEYSALDLVELRRTIQLACLNLSDVDADLILRETLKNLYDGIPAAQLRQAITLTSRALIEKEPQYSYVSARLLLRELHEMVAQALNLPQTKAGLPSYSALFEPALQAGINAGLLSTELKKFNWRKLAAAIQPERDLLFNYLGLQTLYDRYFLHINDERIEMPQFFFMRVAMGLALQEQDHDQSAIEFYQVLSAFDFMSSTPTLFNAGTTRPQLSSCFLTTIPDDLKGIYDGIRDNALLQKSAGGLGNDWTPVRALNAYIKGTNGKSQGVVPFMKVANDTAVAVNQGGKRKGAVCAYLETWHLDIEEFLELRKNTGDERRRTHDMNTANWIPDLFMERVFQQAPWTLFSPDEVPDLHELYGADFQKRYEEYEAQADRGEIKNYKVIPAIKLWRKMLGLLFETGHPWLTFKDPCNLRSPQQHVGVVHSSNLCTEITLNTNAQEIAVCNLGSINLAQHIQNGKIDDHKLALTVKTAVRMLDNVIDINYYPVPQAKHSNLQHRPIGLGIMGFQDALYQLQIPYESSEAVEFADICMEKISYMAISASIELAAERGAYASYTGSLWSKNIFPIDSIDLLRQHRGAEYLEQDSTHRLEWDVLRAKMKRHGMRHSNVLAIAPTATISNICGVSQSIEPTYQNLYVKSNLSGEFTVVNPYLVAELKQRGLWDEAMVTELKYHNGSVQSIDRIPDDLKIRFKTAFEIDSSWLIEAASRRQKWIDQAQSLNLYLAQASGQKLDQLYKLAWKKGLKTTYYLRSLGATSTEKSTLTDQALRGVTAPQSCSIDNPSCESCQ